MTKGIDQRLSSLEGTRVIQTDTSEGGTTLFFESGEVLAIYAPVSLKTPLGRQASNFDEVAGTVNRLNRVFASGEKLILQFEAGGGIGGVVRAGKELPPENFPLVNSDGAPPVWGK